MTDEKWTPPADVRPWIVCAACKYGDFIATGARHFDEVMVRQATAWLETQGLQPRTMGRFDQGFIDQWGRFWGREEAMELVKESGQPFNRERNGPGPALFSEGLY